MKFAALPLLGWKTWAVYYWAAAKELKLSYHKAGVYIYIYIYEYAAKNWASLFLQLNRNSLTASQVWGLKDLVRIDVVINVDP